MKKINLSIVSGILILISTAVSATPTLMTVGVGAVTGTVDCARTSNGNCKWRTTDPSGYDTIGSSVHTPTSGSSFVSDVRGVARASGEANLTSYLPTLHAYASGNGQYSSDFSSLAGTIYRAGSPDIVYTGAGSSIADANAWAVQGYQYTGMTPFDLTITGTLDSIFSGDGQNGRTGHSFFSLVIFDAAGYVFDPDSGLGFSASMCPIFGNPSTFCPANPTIRAYSSRNNLYNTGSLSATVGHTFDPGDKFFVGAFLDASVCCGLTADSSHTLNLAFNDATQLDSIPVPGVVPEPDSIFLFMTGMALIARYRRWGSKVSITRR